MIRRIFADKPGFKEIRFSNGLNVILADKDDSSDEKDSRNGIGKSSVIEVIHFCLGSDLGKSKTLKKPELRDWTFSIELLLNGKPIIASRNTSRQNTIIVEGDTSSFPLQPSIDEELAKNVYQVNAWNDLLGKLFFDIPTGLNKPKYSATFRGLVSYIARRGRDAYTKPFEYFRSQPPWQIQVFNSYLLDLSWEYARDWQLLKDREEELGALKSASQKGLFDHLVGTQGELEVLKLRLASKVKAEEEQLNSFKVHPKYKEIEEKANLLTAKIHELTNSNISASRTQKMYEESLENESSASTTEVENIYREAGLVLPERVTKSLAEVLNFHQTVTKNRASFITEEINKLKKSIISRNEQVLALSNERAEQLEVLKTHKALDEHNRLQGLLSATKGQYEEVLRKIDLLKKFEEGKSAVKIEKEELKVKTRRDLEERETSRSKAVSLFNTSSERLYNKPGQLIIDITDSGFSFKVEIERSESDGIQLMEVYCYDLVIAQIWSQKQKKPGFLIHDSTVFADVDERQVARAIEMANQISTENNFQYICCLNSDHVPWNEFSENFDLKSFIKLELKDDPAEACLFGMRF